MALPNHFIYLTDLSLGIVEDIRYAGNNNFLGTKVDGYHTAKAILTKAAAFALASAQQQAKRESLSLIIFDAFRPTRAIQHFHRWENAPENSNLQKRFYPNLGKTELFEKGYIANQSSHSRGSTVDLSLIDIKTQKELDMGTEFDFFGEASWENYTNLTQQQFENRQLLKHIMVASGFKTFPMEWWHFTLVDEPYPDTYFDFPVE
jgi:D-alanyl-D-alanine dipeptidase